MTVCCRLIIETLDETCMTVNMETVKQCQEIMSREDTTSHDIFYLQDQSFYLSMDGSFGREQPTGPRETWWKVYGSPWTPAFYSWGFMYTDKEQDMIVDRIPDDTDILITHGPPRHVLDKNIRGILCGCPALLRRYVFF